MVNTPRFRAWDEVEGVMYYSEGYSSVGREYMTLSQFWSAVERYDMPVWYEGWLFWRRLRKW